MSTNPARPEPISIALTLVPTSGGEPTSVVVTGDSATTFGEVRPLLPGRWPATPLYAGATEVDDAHLLGRSPLLHATQLTTARQRAGRRPLLELAVAEGPAAGSLHPLTAGGVLVGTPRATSRCSTRRSPARTRACSSITDGCRCTTSARPTAPPWTAARCARHRASCRSVTGCAPGARSAGSPRRRALDRCRREPAGSRCRARRARSRS